MVKIVISVALILVIIAVHLKLIVEVNRLMKAYPVSFNWQQGLKSLYKSSEFLNYHFPGKNEKITAMRRLITIQVFCLTGLVLLVVLDF